jgi:hypothetical protein
VIQPGQARVYSVGICTYGGQNYEHDWKEFFYFEEYRQTNKIEDI